jgi:copper chaperone CopZ
LEDSTTCKSNLRDVLYKSTQGENKMTTVTYTIPAISCSHCTHTIETEVSEIQGVQSVKADEATKKVVITFDNPADEKKIKALLAEINYPAEGLITL